MTRLEELLERKKKAESLAPEELNKYIESYLKICVEIKELKGEYKNNKDYPAAVTSSLISAGIKSHYPFITEFDNCIFNAVKNGNLKIIDALVDYVETKKAIQRVDEEVKKMEV